MTTSKYRMHKLGLGVCKRGDCKYSYRQVPARLWENDGESYCCPECGYRIAPDSIDEDAERRIKEMFFNE